MFLEVRPSNMDAERLYRRRGFEEVGFRPAYYQAEGGREDALVMQLDLLSTP
jgi:ribosomal-protein-alanine N-acetyltransferase